MADLTWKVSGITYCGGNGSDEWVNVSPSSGFVDENTTLTISVIKSSGGTGDCSAATVVITASTGDIQEIPVTRCLRECNCESIIVSGIPSSETISACSQTNVIFGKYNTNCDCSDSVSAKTTDANIESIWVDKNNGIIYGNVKKNETKEGNDFVERDVFCDVYINGKPCGTLSRRQRKLTGTYSEYVTGRTEVTGVTATASTDTRTFGCEAASFSVTGTSHYKGYGIYAWKDSCDDVHYDMTEERETGGGTTPLGVKSGSFTAKECCEGGGTDSVTIEFSDGGYSKSFEFTQNCPDCGPCGSCYISGPETLECEGTANYNIITP